MTDFRGTGCALSACGLETAYLVTEEGESYRLAWVNGSLVPTRGIPSLAQ